LSGLRVGPIGEITYDPGSGSDRSVQDKLRSIGITPGDEGAVGDGSTNDRVALLAANSGNGRVHGDEGKTYRISADTTIGVFIANGAVIEVDSGQTLTVDQVISGNDVCFTGAGTVVITSHFYNLAWFEGATANAKFDFLKKGLEINRQWTLYIPTPKPSDPAAIEISGFGELAWDQTAPLIFGDPENNCTILMEGFLIATASMTAQIQFGNIVDEEKTESIRAPLGLKLYGDALATYGLYIPLAAHIDIPLIEAHKHQSSFCIESGLVAALAVNDISIGKIYGAYLTGSMVDIMGKAGVLADSIHIKEIHFDGATPSTVNSIVRVRGVVRGLQIDMIRDEASVGNGLYDVDTAIVDVNTITDATRAPEGVKIGTIFWNISTGSPPIALKVRNTVGGTEPDPKNIICDDFISRTNPSGHAFDLTVGSNHRVRGRDNGKTVNVGATCTDIYLDNFRITDCTIDNAASNVVVNGSNQRRVAITAAAAISIPVPSHLQEGVMLNMTAMDAGGTMRYLQAALECSSGASAVKVAGSADVDVTTGALTGSTGTASRITVSADNGLIYIENRLAGTETVRIEF
jgi:hypothetical protein